MAPSVASGGEESIEDTQTSGAIYSGLTQDALTSSWRTIFKYHGCLVSNDLSSSDGSKATCTVAFRMPDEQRCSLAIRVKLPMNMDKQVNPRQYTRHTIEIKIPAASITGFNFRNFDDGHALTSSDCFEATGEGFLNRDKVPLPLASLKIKADRGFVTGLPVPSLTFPALRSEILEFISQIRGHTTSSRNNLDFDLIVRRRESRTSDLATRFEACIAAERVRDPALDWIMNSPKAEAFTKGNLIPDLEQPKIPLQPAETVFIDKKDYLISHIYGAMSEVSRAQAIISSEAASASKGAIASAIDSVIGVSSVSSVSVTLISSSTVLISCSSAGLLPLQSSSSASSSGTALNGAISFKPSFGALYIAPLIFGGALTGF